MKHNICCTSQNKLNVIRTYSIDLTAKHPLGAFFSLNTHMPPRLRPTLSFTCATHNNGVTNSSYRAIYRVPLNGPNALISATIEMNNKMCPYSPFSFYIDDLLSFSLSLYRLTLLFPFILSLYSFFFLSLFNALPSVLFPF